MSWSQYLDYFPKPNKLEQLIDSLDHSYDVEADWRAHIAKKRESEPSAIIANEKPTTSERMG